MILIQKTIKIFSVSLFLILCGCASKPEVVNNCPVYPFTGTTVEDMFWYIYDRQTIDEEILNGGD